MPNLLSIIKNNDFPTSFFEDYLKPILISFQENKFIKYVDFQFPVGVLQVIFGSSSSALRSTSLPDEIWHDSNNTGILDLLNAYKWASNYQAENGSSLLPDIFNTIYLRSIQAPKKSGSFYTPVEIVERISRTAIRNFILFQLNQQLNQSYNDMKDVTRDLKTPEQKKILKKILSSIKIIDPAMGSGLFIISTLKILLEMRMNCITLDEPRDKQFYTKNKPPYSALMIKQIITSNLYGVDLQVEAIRQCKLQIWLFYLVGLRSLSKNELELLNSDLRLEFNLNEGNSLIGRLNTNEDRQIFTKLEETKKIKPFHWWKAFPGVMASGGFDVVLGNPPYGDRVLSPWEKLIIERLYPKKTSKIKDQKGSKNAASVFIERIHSLLKLNGVFGLIVPNSIARSREFSKTRDLLLEDFRLLEIGDEGAPFKGVTLEMITIFGIKLTQNQDYEIKIINHRNQHEKNENRVKKSVFKKYDRFMLYWDETWERIIDRAEFNMIVGKRGMVPRDKIQKQHDSKFRIPVLFSGKSIKKYMLVSSFFEWGSDAILDSAVIRKAMESPMLLATRLDNYIRATYKPAGFVPGDNVIKLTLNEPKYSLKEILLILNSKLFGYIVPKYLFNRSQKTSWLQSIVHLIPLKKTPHPPVFEFFSNLLIHLNQYYYDSFLLESTRNEEIEDLIKYFEEMIADTLVFELYFLPPQKNLLCQYLNQLEKPLNFNFKEILSFQKRLRQDSRLHSLISRIRELEVVTLIENNPNVQEIEKKKRAF
ncbi:MAG: Eco57I restriction-modification methylase domain-containing protein [Candidatus Helarchaeota archaeon]